MSTLIYENGKYRELTTEELSQGEQINPYDGMSYAELVRMFMAERYAIEDEIAIINDKEDKPEEHFAYMQYRVECKARAKQILGIE
jgi:hypothetical protein